MRDTASRRESLTRHLFQRKILRLRGLAIGGITAVVGGAMMQVYGGIGVVFVLIGAALIVVAILRGRRPLITVEPTGIVLRFGESVSVNFGAISRVEQLKTDDLQLWLRAGSKVLIPMSKLEEEDGAWLKKALRKEMRAASAP